MQLAFVFVLVDIFLGGPLPLWLVFAAGLYIFFEGCLKAKSIVHGLVSG
jgi:hypothetical protein